MLQKITFIGVCVCSNMFVSYLKLQFQCSYLNLEIKNLILIIYLFSMHLSVVKALDANNGKIHTTDVA